MSASLHKVYTPFFITLSSASFQFLLIALFILEYRRVGFSEAMDHLLILVVYASGFVTLLSFAAVIGFRSEKIRGLLFQPNVPQRHAVYAALFVAGALFTPVLMYVLYTGKSLQLTPLMN